MLVRGIQVNQSCAAYSEPPNEIKVLVEAKFKRACGFVIPWILLSVATHEQIRTNQSRFTVFWMYIVLTACLYCLYTFGLFMVCVPFRLPRFFLLNRGEHHYRPIDEGVYVLLFLIIKSPSRYRNEYWHTRAKHFFRWCTWLSQVMHYFRLESAYFFTFSKGLKEYIYQDLLPWNLFDIYS